MISCYNEHLRKDIILNEGEEYCPKCNGGGLHVDIKTTKWLTYSRCKKCLGKGKLDWIEQAMGVNPSTIDVSIRQEFLNEAANYLANKIDKEIMNTIKVV